ncbi:MAG TPA: alpha/beta hydrolase, partial [Albitalea sp.]|nr:alpha/beta hydrolase [Albitalea sp.]
CIALRIYVPFTPCAGPRPLLVWLHGGGFVLGDLETADATCRSLANRSGAVVVSADYALAPERGCVAAADDAYHVLRWAVANARTLGCDPQRVVIGGESAGGTLSALATLRARDAAEPLPALQVLVYPCTDCSMELSDHRPGTAQLLTWESVDWFAAHCFAELDPASPSISPYRAVRHDGLPPALVITAECDLLCPDGEAYAERLREAGNAVTLTRYAGQIHGFFTMDLAFPAARAAQNQVARAIAALRPGLQLLAETDAPPLQIAWSSPARRALAAGRALSERLPTTTLLRAGRTVWQHKLHQLTTAAFANSEAMRGPGAPS